MSIMRHKPGNLRNPVEGDVHECHSTTPFLTSRGFTPTVAVECMGGHEIHISVVKLSGPESECIQKVVLANLQSRLRRPGLRGQDARR